MRGDGGGEGLGGAAERGSLVVNLGGQAGAVLEDDALDVGEAAAHGVVEVLVLLLTGGEEEQIGEAEGGQDAGARVVIGAGSYEGGAAGGAGGLGGGGVRCAGRRGEEGETQGRQGCLRRRSHAEYPARGPAKAEGPRRHRRMLRGPSRAPDQARARVPR